MDAYWTRGENGFLYVIDSLASRTGIEPEAQGVVMT
jgi:hypothetical protein